jgi:hypothetical protein
VAAASAPTAAGAAVAPLTTAAELVRAPAVEVPRVPPEAFHQGMIVRHPEYGLGKVVGLNHDSGRCYCVVS